VNEVGAAIALAHGPVEHEHDDENDGDEYDVPESARQKIYLACNDDDGQKYY
jgi:hypothetical protein